MGGSEEYADHPVRSYVMTDGRAHPSRNTIRPETLLVADPDKPVPLSASHRQRALLDICGGVLSLAEAAAYLRLPVSLVVVLASDLVDSEHLSIRCGAPRHDLPERHVIEKVLNGLREL